MSSSSAEFGETVVLRQRITSSCKRVLVKVGTAVVTDDSGHMALGRIGSIIDQIRVLFGMGISVVLVSSGSVAVGRRISREVVSNNCSGMTIDDVTSRACAAIGQSELMSMYETLFSQHSMHVSQILLQDEDFLVPMKRKWLTSTLDQLLAMGIVPIINENDVVSTRKEDVEDEEKKIFWDNDSLASNLALLMDMDLVILLSDVDGLYRTPPDKGLSLMDNMSDFGEMPISQYDLSERVEMGSGSRVGRGGMQSKIESAIQCMKNGIPVIIASGYRRHILENIMGGEDVGTLFYVESDP